MPKGQNIEVYLETEMTLAHAISVFGEGAPSVDQIVDCGTIPTARLYGGDVSNGLFEVWEGADRGDISGDLTSRDAAHGLTSTGDSDFKNYINQRLGGSGAAAVPLGLDATAAVPFSTYSATAVDEYVKYGSIGELALAWAAHYLFGHVQATAAITNDAVIVSDINTAVTAPTTGLADLLLNKSPADITTIVKHVVGQDPERLKDDDNNELTPDRRIALAFYAGDVFYFKVNMSGWSASYSGSSAAEQSTLDSRISNAENGSGNHFYLKFTLA